MVFGLQMVSQSAMPRAGPGLFGSEFGLSAQSDLHGTFDGTFCGELRVIRIRTEQEKYDPAATLIELTNY